MNLRQLAYGLLSFLPWVPESLYKGTGGTDSAEYCYCIWLRHLVLAHQGGMRQFPASVAELGPGDSIGVGLAALLSGSARYVAIDALEHADTSGNLRVFDGLVELFQRRARIPGKDKFPGIALELPNHAFPIDLLGGSQLSASLAPDRVADLRRIVSGEVVDSTVIDYRPRGGQFADTDIESIDFLVSNAVMEHVADLDSTYSAVARCLRLGGYASHQIDFRSHSLFRAWDGHWACPDWLWALFMGRRGYLINREPFATHRRLAEKSGLTEAFYVRDRRVADARRLAPRFRQISAEDRTTCGAYILSRKVAAGEVKHS